MAQGLQVNGVPTLKTGTGSSGTLETLGYGVYDTCEIEFEDLDEPVFTDEWGGRLPEDEQMMGKVALVRVLLANFDEVVLAKVRNRSGTSADDATAGDLKAIGTFWGPGGSPVTGSIGNYFRLLVTSPIAALPYNFLAARLRGSYPVKLSTKFTRWALLFFCRPVVVSNVKVLFNRTTV